LFLCGARGGDEKCIQNFDQKPFGHGWDDNIRMDLREIVWEGMDWINLAQDMDQWRVLVNAVMNLRVPWGGGGVDQLSEY
jgi:hypothetical protein